jgi:hypothetical protein
VLNFFSLSRFSDLATISRSSIPFDANPLHMKILFVGIKNDIYSEGGLKVVVSNSDQPCYCPVLLTQKYLRYLGADFQGKMLPTCLAKDQKRPLMGSNVTYRNALKDIRELLTALGYPGAEFGEHSAK